MNGGETADRRPQAKPVRPDILGAKTAWRQTPRAGGPGGPPPFYRPREGAPSGRIRPAGPGYEAQFRMLTARETTTATVTREASDCSIISSLAQAVSGMVSVGLKAVALVKDV